LAGRRNTIGTSYTRNFPGRNDGQRTTMHFIASPEIVTALALAGRLSFNPLTDPLTGADGRSFRLEPPRPAPDVPARPFERGDAGRIAPSRDRAGEPLRLPPRTARLQRLQPCPPCDR